MRKILCIFSAMVMLATSSLVFTACGNSGEAPEISSDTSRYTESSANTERTYSENSSTESTDEYLIMKEVAIPRTSKSQLLDGIDLTDDQLEEIYQKYKLAFLSSPTDPLEDVEYEKQLAKKVGKEYGITPDQADCAYMYVCNLKTAFKNNQYYIKNGYLLGTIPLGTTLRVNVDIFPLSSNKRTIEQNYQNVFYIIQTQTKDKFDQIEYRATANMTNGKNAVAVSFTIPSETIEKILNKKIKYSELGEYVDDLYIIPSLLTK